MNHEDEPFIGELKVQALEGGRAVLLTYSARLKSGDLAHTESTLLGTGPDGKLCLWPVMSELPVVLAHTEVMTQTGAGKSTRAVFASGSRDASDTFREEITIQINADASLVYAHAWGLPGGRFEDRSSCRMMHTSAAPAFHLVQHFMSLAFETTASPSAEDLAVVDAGLGDHNAAEPELQKVVPLTVLARDVSGQIKAGAIGRTWGQCCELQQLWVGDAVRGQDLGSQLMDRFEAEARRRGCSLVYLDTFTFQAKPFYEKRGFTVALETAGFTNGIVKYTMHKRLL